MCAFCRLGEGRAGWGTGRCLGGVSTRQQGELLPAPCCQPSPWLLLPRERCRLGRPPMPRPTPLLNRSLAQPLACYLARCTQLCRLLGPGCRARVPAGRDGPDQRGGLHPGLKEAPAAPARAASVAAAVAALAPPSPSYQMVLFLPTFADSAPSWVNCALVSLCSSRLPERGVGPTNGAWSAQLGMRGALNAAG